MVVALTLGTLSVAGVGLFFAVKARPRAPRVCRVCGTGVEGAGDLCASCRREAELETVRRATAERAERQRALTTIRNVINATRRRRSDGGSRRKPRTRNSSSENWPADPTRPF